MKGTVAKRSARVHDRPDRGGGGRGGACALVGIVLLVTSAACASLPGRNSPDEEEAATAIVPVELIPPPPDSAPPRSGNERARKLLAQGSFREAGAQYEEVLRTSGGSQERAEAMWGLALVHLLPESPLHDPDEASRGLDTLADRFPRTVPGMQAAWIRDLLGALDDSQAQVADRERLLREVRDTLERLREIDLERRPTGRSRPDSLDLSARDAPTPPPAD